MKSTRNLRKNVTFGEKFHYLALAIDEMDIRRDAKFKTDLIGLACQFSSQPKLKREDFKGMLDMSIQDVLTILKLK
jgi:hypothetical protein